MIISTTTAWKTVFCLLFAAVLALPRPGTAAALIIDHNTTDITQIPLTALEQAKASLHIAYAHTSHGSQLTTGMTGLTTFANNGGLGLTHPDNTFQWNNGGTGGALDLHDKFVDGDLGDPDRTTWAQRTRDYLDHPDNADVNVIIWSWCGQVGISSLRELNTYLTLMNALEADYPGVQFVYMTGHAVGTGDTESLHLNNQIIRDYCQTNGKILYDFYDIELYDPDGNYYGDKRVDDECNYDSTGNGYRDANWATAWQATHTQGIDWYDCPAAHSEPLNANQKAYAAWWLWASLAGWEPDEDDPTGDPNTPDNPAPAGDEGTNAILSNATDDSSSTCFIGTVTTK